jgi:hypothetical protein
MSSPAVSYLVRQFETAWKLTSHHLEGLTTEECLWRPARQGLHVQQTTDGQWRPDWPDHEGYDLGPPSIAWLTWHMIFWWSMVLDHSFGAGTLTRDEIMWPGSVDATRAAIVGLQERWRAKLAEITDESLRLTERTRWPFTQRPFADVVAWVNIELTKNTAEIGFARFLYAAETLGDRATAR